MYVNLASAPIWLFVVSFFTKNQAHTHTLTHTRAHTHTHTQRRFHVCVYYVHTRIMYVIFVAPHSHKLIITIRLLLLLLSFLLLRSSSSSFLIIFVLLLYFIFICLVSSSYVHIFAALLLSHERNLLLTRHAIAHSYRCVVFLTKFIAFVLLFSLFFLLDFWFSSSD